MWRLQHGVWVLLILGPTALPRSLAPLAGVGHIPVRGEKPEPRMPWSQKRSCVGCWGEATAETRVKISSDAGGHLGRECGQIRDGHHALSGDHAVVFQLPVLLLFQPNCPLMAGDRRVVG
jgi:hypothetical protein